MTPLRSLDMQVSDESAVAPTDVDTASEGDEGVGDDGPATMRLSANGDLAAASQSLKQQVDETTHDDESLIVGVELPLLEDEDCWKDFGMGDIGIDGEYRDESGRMNGTPSNYHYEPLQRPVSPCRAYRRVRSRTPPRDASRSGHSSFPPAAPVRVRSSAFGTGVLITNNADYEAGYQAALRRIRGIMATGAAFYIGITENPPRRFSEHVATGGYDDLEILAEARTSATTGALETRLLDVFLNAFMCQNTRRGGEGASGGSPHYCYVAWRRNGLLRRRGRR